MMGREIFPYRTSRIIKAKHPIDVEADEPLDFTGDGSTCSFKVYDPAKDEVISVVEASGQTELSVSNAGVFVIGDTIEVEENDGSILATTINAVDADAGTITNDDALTNGAAVGKRVRRIFGAAVTMTEYGTPALDQVNWGFRGTLLSTHACHIIDQDIDVEISFVGDPGNPGTLDAQETISATVKEVDAVDD
jgi:hypothetical protein